MRIRRGGFWRSRRSTRARIGGVGLQIIRDWVLRFNSEGAAGLVDRKAPGRTPLMTDELRAMGFRKLSARPRHHAQDPEAIKAFKKTSPLL